MVFSPLVEATTLTDFLSSGTKIFFFWRFGFTRLFPVGLNWVARTRLLYPPTTLVPLLVIGQIFAIDKGYAIITLTYMQIETLFVILILILSVVIHEVMHGYAAHALGDPTAKLAGRLTLNPIKHIDLMGSIIIPGILVLSHSPFLFGYAKPVPYNPYNLRNQRWGEAIVAFAGPGINIVIALVFGLAIRIGVSLDAVTPAFVELGSVVVFINILLAVLNLIPIPPLDGSKVLASVLPYQLAQSYSRYRALLEQNIFLAFGFILLFIFFFGGVFVRFIYSISSLIIGI